MLERVPLFAGMSAEELEFLETHAVKRSYRKNTIIIEEGDGSTSLYVLLSGRVRVYVADEDGQEVVLGLFDDPGVWFGELALVGDTKRTASVITLSDSTLLIISQEDFMRYLHHNPKVAWTMIRHLVCQIKTLTTRVSILALNDVYGRVVATLRELARPEGDRLVTGSLTQKEVANMVGASREMVSRIFKELKLGGYISQEGKRLVLLKKLPNHW